jgi:dimethylhistidine N-methyltransferase
VDFEPVQLSDMTLVMKGKLFQEIIDGLQANPASISPKYFYDELGSSLFQAITHLEEYYPTRVERGIMQSKLSQITQAIASVDVIVELGAGNCEKVRPLLETIAPKQYRALDISADFLETALANLHHDYPAIDMRAIAADITQELSFPDLQDQRILFFYPGSSIGNFNPPEASRLFSNLARECHGSGGLLIGVDLVKDIHVLERAYNDILGVTAAFNLNALRHLNHLIGSNFAIPGWEHCAFFNQTLDRIEMHLRAKSDQLVSWPGGHRQFFAGEMIHTENSYKYPKATFLKMLQEAGFTQVTAWTDPESNFLVCFAELK